MEPALANDKYRATLRSTFVDGVDTTLAVTAIPTNLPTIVVVGWNTLYETVFRVEGTSGTNSSNYSLTGVTKLRGYTGNLPENLALNCLNVEEYFNQWGDLIAAMQVVIDSVAIATVGLIVVAPDTDLEVGDAKAFFRVPARLNGMNLIGVAATIYTAGTTGVTEVQLRNKTDSVDMLSTKVSVDSEETDSSTAATPAVIDTTKDDVATGDVIAIDIDTIHTTPGKGLYIEMTFETP
jgi:hypothetical protein